MYIKKITSWRASAQKLRLNPKAKILKANTHMHICTDFVNKYTEQQKVSWEKEETHRGRGVARYKAQEVRKQSITTHFG